MEKEKYIFYVVIPIYNVEKYLEEKIESVIKQDIGFSTNIQIILVNDGSKDKSEIYLLDRDSKKDRKMKQDLLKQIDYKPVWLVLDRHIH